MARRKGKEVVSWELDGGMGRIWRGGYAIGVRVGRGGEVHRALRGVWGMLKEA